VTAQAVLVEDTKTDVSQLVNTRQILELPINGRRVDSFVLLTPAVVPDGAFGLLSFRGIGGHNGFFDRRERHDKHVLQRECGRTRNYQPDFPESRSRISVISIIILPVWPGDGRIVNTNHEEWNERIFMEPVHWFFRNRTERSRPFCCIQIHRTFGINPE